MRNMLRSRRGSAAFATVIALVPLIGAIALGAEAGSWYVTRQHAQNAADAAAYSGALRLACRLSGAGASCDTSQSEEYRGKQVAAQHSFCQASDPNINLYPGRRCVASLEPSQEVRIDIGDYSAGTFTPASNGNAVRAQIRQHQKTYLASLLGSTFTTIDIGSQAIALVDKSTDLCALSLGPDPNGGNGALKLAGNSSNNGTGCGMMSNGSVQFASTPSFSGSGWAVYGATGCSPTGTCASPGVTHNYFMPPALDPLQALKTASFNSRTGNTNPSCPVQPDGWKHCTPNSGGTGAYGNFPNVSGSDKYVLDPGTYIFYNAGTIQITGGQLKGTGVTLVLLGTSSLKITGGTVDLSAPTTNTFSSALNGVLIDAPQATGNININGSGTVKLGGAMYFPKADVSFSGTTQPTNTTCSEVIAATLTIGGTAYLSNSGCVPGTVARTQVVHLVQ